MTIENLKIICVEKFNDKVNIYKPMNWKQVENGTFEFDIPQETLRRLEEFYQSVNSKRKEDIEENSEEEGTTRPPKPNIEVCRLSLVHVCSTFRHIELLIFMNN